jgi:hypothetical protein
MDNIKRIFFRVAEKDDQHVDILADTPDGEVKIGQIFGGCYDLIKTDKPQPFSGPNSIQICGFDAVEGPWSCGVFNHSMDICLKWNSVTRWLKEKVKT